MYGIGRILLFSLQSQTKIKLRMQLMFLFLNQWKCAEQSTKMCYTGNSRPWLKPKVNFIGLFRHKIHVNGIPSWNSGIAWLCSLSDVISVKHFVVYRRKHQRIFRVLLRRLKCAEFLLCSAEITGSIRRKIPSDWSDQISSLRRVCRNVKPEHIRTYFEAFWWKDAGALQKLSIMLSV